MIRMRFIALAAMLCGASALLASPFTSNGTGGGNWNSSATWGGAGVPGAGDTVTISGGDLVFVTDTRSALTILIDTTATLRIDSTGNLTVGGTGTAVTINAPVIPASTKLQLSGGTMSLSSGGIAVNGDVSGTAKIDYDASGGTLNVATDITFSNSNAQLTFNTAGNLNIGGTLGSGGTVSAANSTIAFNGTGSQTIGGPYTFYNLSITKATGTATLAAPTNVFGNLTVASGIFDDGGNQITLNSGFTSNVNIGATGVLKLGSAASATTFPANLNPGLVFFTPGSAVAYHAGVGQVIDTSITYRRLYLNTTGPSVTHSFSGVLQTAEELDVSNNGPNTTMLAVGANSLIVNGDVNGDGTINVSGGNINLRGNWSSSSTLAAGAGSTVTYDGTGAQSVRAAAYHHLVISKASGTATFAGTTSTAGNLTVTAGTVDLGTQTVTVTGTLTNNGSLAFNTATVILLGDLTNNASIFSPSATLKMNGTAAQAINSSLSAINIATFEINNAAGVSVITFMGVTSALKLFGGNVTVTGFIYVTLSATVTRTSGWIVGPLRMGFEDTTPRRMEIGTAVAYMPIDIDAGSGGDIQARAVEGLHANRTGTRLLNRYWRIESPSSVLPIDSITFNYNLTDINSGNEFEFMLGHYNGASWTREGDVVNEGPHTATLTNVSDYVDDDWVVGHAGSMGGAGKLKITQINGGVNPVANAPFDVDVETWTDDDSSTGDVFGNPSVDILLETGTGSLSGNTGFIAPGTHAATIGGNTYDTAESGVQLRADGSSGDALDDGVSALFTVGAPPSTLTVTSINDNGPGTLREAIDTLEANGCAVPCTINFSTSGNILLLTPLATITRGDVTIDASTAPGSIPNTNAFGQPSNAILSVSLDGSNNIDVGFEIFSANVVIRGFAIKNFVNGGTGKAVKFTGSNTGSAVAGCYIGTDTTGFNAAPNSNGVYFLASFGGTAGGSTPADRNVISGNTVYGVYAGAGSSNINVLGNYIGTKADLSGPLGNDDGVWISSSSDATIGSDTFDGNVISGNLSEGIDFDGAGAIYGNLIGTNGIGTAAIPNNTGIEISGNAEIGGSWSPERNIISGNTTHGIHVTGDGSNIDNNYIGVGLNGTTSIPNGGSGIRLSGNANGNRIGVITGNRIAHNVGRGVSVATTTTGIANAIRQNVIHSNGSLAIDLGEDGPTANDATDPDTGANNLQNFPTISAANISGSNVQLTVSVDSSGSLSPTANFIIDVYKTNNTSPTPALEHLGASPCVIALTLTNYTFSVPQGTTVSGDRIVVTATSYAIEIVGFARIVTSAGCINGQTDGTSELSASAVLGGDIHWNNASGGAWEVATNWNPQTVPGVNDVAFIDLSGTYTVTVNSAITVDKLHVGGGISGVQSLNINGGTSLQINNPSDVATNGNLTVNGTLTGNGTLDVNGTLDWNADTISGVAALNINSGATLNFATGGTKTLLQRLLTVNIGGTANWNGGSIALQTGGGIVNAGTFDIKTDNSLVDNGADAGFTNSGLLRKSVTAGTTFFSAVDLFHNAGTLDVQTGVLDLAGGSSASSIAISSGAEVLINSDLFTFNNGTSTSGAGKVQTASLGILNVDGALITIEHLYVNGGNVAGSGVATTGATGTWQWDQGTMSGPGTSRIASGGSMNIPGASGKFLGRTLDIVSGGAVNLGGTGALNLQAGGNIVNAGTFDIIGDPSIFNSGSSGPIANSGTFKRSTSSGTATLNNVDLNHTAGTLEIFTGTLDVAGGTSSAPITIAGGATFLVNSNIYTFVAGTTVGGAGGVDVMGGTLTVSGNVSIPKLTQGAGTIDGAGTLTIANTGAWASGTMQGSGITEVANGATLTLSTGSVKNLNTRALSTVNGGTINWTAGTLALNTGANINNTGLFHAQFDGSITNGGTAGTFTNNGTLRKSGTTGFTNFFLPLSNVSGTVDIQNGIIGAGAGYSQGAAGILKLHLAGTTAGTGYGQLNPASNPTLGGTLEVVLVNPFDPVGGDSFRAVLIAGGTHTGDFIQPYTLPALNAGRTWSDAFDASGLLLSVTGSADLSIAKTAPSNNVVVGAPIAYTITVTNTSTDAATSVVVTDTLPPGHTGIGASGSGWNCNVVSDTVTCTAVAPLPNGNAPAITINATAPNTPQTFTNVASVTSSNDPNSGNNSGSWPITVDPNTVDLDLTSVSPPSPLAPASPFTFDFILTNQGPQTATGVTFSAPIPPELTWNSATPDTGTCNFSTNTVTCNIGSIAASSNKHVLLGLTTGTTPGTHYVIGTGASTETDSQPSNNSVAAQVSVTGTTLTVVNTNDSGSGSLRQALTDSQNVSLCPAPCTIAFNIGAGPFVIQPLQDLPAVAPNVIVDATTQPGYSGTPIIQVDGGLNAGSPLLVLSGTNAKVKGLSLTGALKGAFITGSSNKIEACFVGLDPSGAADANSYGVFITGNLNTVGGATAGTRNVISGNTNQGVWIEAGAIANVVAGNYIGTDPAGMAARPNAIGVEISGTASSNTIGGGGSGNTISGNGEGVVVTGPNTGVATIAGNRIGIASDGSTPLANTGHGVAINNASGVRVGTTTSGDGNQIAHNGGEGVIVTGTGVSNHIIDNQIFNNTGLGIDLDDDGVTPNDAGDGDAPFANNRQNWPNLTGVFLNGGGDIHVTYNIDSSAAANTASISVQLFEADSAVSGEGKLPRVSVCHNGADNFGAGLNFNDPSYIVGSPFVMTATSYSDANCTTVSDGTSEFSNVVLATTCTPPAAAVNAPANACANSTSNAASVNAPTATSFTWSVGGGGTLLTGQGTPNITFSAPASGTVTLSVVVTDASGCPNTANANVLVVPPVQPTITGPTAVCPGGTVQLDAGAGFSGHAWSTLETTRFINVSPAVATTYSVTTTDANGCTASDNHTVTIHPTPVVNISGPTSSCASAPVVLDAGPFASWSWSTGASTQTITVSPSSTTTYSVTVTDGNGCTAGDSHTVTIVANPTATINAPAAACASSTNNNASVPAGASSYVWTITGGAITAGQNTNSITFSANASGSVQLGVTVTSGSCTSTGTTTLPITAPPTVTITGPTTACPFAPFTLDAGVFTTYQWSNGSTSRFLTVSQSSASVVYSVIVTDANGCSGSDTHTVTLTPISSTISAPASVPSSTGGHTASVPAQPGATFVWSITNGTITAGTGTSSITFSANASGSVSLSVTVSLSGCTSNGFTSIPIDDGTSDPCALRGTASLIAPANADVLSSSSVVFFWIPSPTATSSRVWLSLNGAPAAILGEVAGNTLTANVPPGHAVWFVEDLFSSCPPSQSAQRTFTIPAGAECNTTPPVITTPANNTSAGTWSVVGWTGVAGANAYEVWMSFEDGGFVRVGTTSDTSLEISPWSAGTYDFFVRALADLCDPVDSAIVRFTYAPSAACLENQRTILVSPLDGDIMTSPASFSWSPRPGATLHEVYVVRENGTPVRIGSTTADALNGVALASGPLLWFVRTYFGQQCSTLDSEHQDLTIVNAPEACSTLTPPVISAPGEISSGVEFLVQWTSDQAATGYELQIASNGTFDGAEVITTGATSHALTRSSGIVFARVRSIDNGCTPPSMSSFGPTAAIFILPPNAAIGTVPLNAPNTATYTIVLGPEFAGQTFNAVPTEEWLSVAPASGVVGAGGTTLTVTADSEGLGLGANTGAIRITLNTSSAGSLATHATTVIIPSISVNVVTPVKPAPFNTPTPDTMIIPGVANADGINSHFQSDVRVANTSPQLIKYQLTFIPSGETGSSAARQTTFSIEPGRTVALDDVLKSWFGTGNQNAIGVLEIKPLTQTTNSISPSPVGALASLVSFASSRTFNVAQNGTFGQYIPAIPFANFIDKSKIISLQQISQSAKYRSNLALFEGSGQAATVLIKVFGANGQQITQFTQNLAGGQHTQLNSFLFSRGITLDDGRVEVAVTSATGKITAVASVLDNQTSDAITVVPVTLESSGNTKWVIPGVADIHSGFANWQSDVRIFNANTTATDVTATFYSQAGGEPKVQTIRMNPGEVKQYDKVLAALFGIGADGGALHLSTAQPSRIVATARTYNDTPTGTYGQFISAVTPGEAVGVGSRPLQILQVEESARMRSNVAFAEVTGKPVKLEVTVTPPDAKFTASIEVDLAANEFRQIGSLLASTLGLSDTYNARISVRAISGEGRALACASVIDLKTNDPTLIQAQ